MEMMRWEISMETGRNEKSSPIIHLWSITLIGFESKDLEIEIKNGGISGGQALMHSLNYI